LEPTQLGALVSYHQHEGASNGLGYKDHLKALRVGTWEAWQNQDEKIQAYKPSLQIGHVLPKILVEVLETRTYLMYHCSSIALLRLHLLQCLHMVGCLCHVLTHEQLTWFD
jgi:hypothetical protein